MTKKVEMVKETANKANAKVKDLMIPVISMPIISNNDEPISLSDIIFVPTIYDIPIDYEGVMSVPMDFLNYYNPKQFKIMGTIEGGSVNGKKLGVRILIKHIHPSTKSIAIKRK